MSYRNCGYKNKRPPYAVGSPLRRALATSRPYLGKGWSGGGDAIRAQPQADAARLQVNVEVAQFDVRAIGQAVQGH